MRRLHKDDEKRLMDLYGETIRSSPLNSMTPIVVEGGQILFLLHGDEVGLIEFVVQDAIPIQWTLYIEGDSVKSLVIRADTGNLYLESEIRTDHFTFMDLVKTLENTNLIYLIIFINKGDEIIPIRMMSYLFPSNEFTPIYNKCRELRW